jgi:hypothetical protein
MKCFQCARDFPEREIEESHDVPCYLFVGFNRKEKKNQADKFGRHWLCKKCHKEYEEGLRLTLKIHATKYAKVFFKEELCKKS